jgi:hypothetical protein
MLRAACSAPTQVIAELKRSAKIMNSSGLSFIVTHIDVDGPVPFDLIDGHSFRAATDQEVIAIQKRLDAVSLHGMPMGGIPYKQVVKEEKYEGGSYYHKEDLPRDKWKYWVIAFDGLSYLIDEIQRAAILLPTDLDIGLTLLFSGANQQGDLIGWTSMPLHLVEKYSDVNEHTKNAKKVSVVELTKIREYYTRISRLPPEAFFVKQAIVNYYTVRAIPSKSELRVVGYFAIIESLITHAPRLSETLDSINHQIVNKLILLRKRFERPIALKTYFLDAGEEKIWKLLYSYRSCLAHGETPDFKTKLQVLKSHDNVILFLKEIIKELIIYGLKEYVFLSDLKKC